MSASLSARLNGDWPAGLDAAAAHGVWLECPPAIRPLLELHRSFLDCILASSPYLRGLIGRDFAFTAKCLSSDPEEVLLSLCSACQKLEDPETAAAGLRAAKSRAALLIALADIGRVWSVAEVTGALTRFADAAVQSAVNALLREAQDGGKLRLPQPGDPAQGCGYTVIAMGKHGAFELNYSSDIDLVVLFDPNAISVAEGQDAAAIFIRLTKKLVALLQDVREDGYVFRVDLRLRPDPRATQVAISTEAAAHYYENLGQNWERAAFIKARAIAGDIALGEDFLKRLQPYIWRKYLDFASIADVQSLIRQIHSVKGHGTIAVEGHNLKLGRGGIREIEFFVQTQQLIAGGRNPALRGRSTIAMLDALAEADWIGQATAGDLKRCYRFLRVLEHRAQMVDDQQTHLVPQKPDAFENFARLCGFPSAAALADEIRKTLQTVKDHSSKLFETSDTLGADSGSLVFTGGEDDPETIETLSRMGFHQPSEVSATIRGWHFGRYAATRTRRAREDLTELMPALLAALARDGDADRSFIDFDGFLARLPSGVQLFAMLKANPNLLELIARILGSAPRLAAELSRQPRVLEAVLEPGFFDELLHFLELRENMASLIPAGLSLEEVMDRARVFAREQQFRVGVRILSDTVSAEEAGEGFANVADVVISALLQAVMAELAGKSGTVAGGRVAVIAMGKLGGREMTASSDLDLILVYDHPENVTQSSGKNPVSSGQYYTKLTQKLITALTALTSEGGLYEVDMRLRPSGSQGPVAVSLTSFKTYHVESAWTWEKLALTRARVVAGDPGLSAELAAAIAATLSAARDETVTRKDVADMRGLMLREHKPASPWDIKRVRGGLVELEFIAQFLQLLHAKHVPAVLNTNTAAAFEALQKAGILENQAARRLLEAAKLYHRLTQVLRLCLDGPYDPASALPGLNRAIAQAAGAPDVRVAEDLLQDHEQAVSGLFDRIIGQPGQKN